MTVPAQSTESHGEEILDISAMTEEPGVEGDELQLAPTEGSFVAANMGRQRPATGPRPVQQVAAAPVGTVLAKPSGGNRLLLPLVAGFVAIVATCLLVIGYQQMILKKNDNQAAKPKERESVAVVEKKNPEDPKDVFELLAGEWQGEDGQRLFLEKEHVLQVIPSEYGKLFHKMEDLQFEPMLEQEETGEDRGIRILCSTVLIPNLEDLDVLTTEATDQKLRIFVCRFKRSAKLREQKLSLQILEERHYYDGRPINVVTSRKFERVNGSGEEPTEEELKTMAINWSNSYSLEQERKNRGR